MITGKEILRVGKFNKPHGVNGELSVTLDYDVELLKQARCIVVDIDGINVPFFIGGVRSKSGVTALITVDDISSQEQASTMVNKDIFVLKDDYLKLRNRADDGGEADDEIEVSFLIGFKAIVNDDCHGEIIDVDDTTANVLFKLLLDDDREVLIPAVDEMIGSIDIDNEIVEFVVPAELLEL